MNPGSKRQPRRRDEARGLFRNAILDAAEEVFAASGYHASRIQDVAASARIAVGTVYNHFDSKDELLAALMEERAAELLRCLEPADGDPTDVAARLGRRIERMLEYVAEHRGFYALLLTYGPLGGSSGETVNMVGRSQRRWQKFRTSFGPLIDEGVAAGLFDAEVASELPAFLWGTIRSVLAQLIFDRDAELVGKAPMVLRLFLHGATRRTP